MASECDSGHSSVVDSITARVVCDRCCRVLDERLSYCEVSDKGISSQETPFIQNTEEEEIFGETVIEVLRKIGDNTYLNQL